MKAKQALVFLQEWVVALALGWYALTLRGLQAVARFLASADRLALGYLALSIALVVVAIAPWITYSIDLMGREKVFLGANLKTIFAIPGLTGILFTLFDIPARGKIQLVTGSLTGALFLAGFAFPDPIFHRLTEDSAHRLLPTIYAYAALLALGTALGLRALQKALLPVVAYLKNEP